MKHFILSPVPFLIFACLAVQVTAQDFETVTYLPTDSVSLEMDLFVPATTHQSRTPLVLYVHGGGFSGGDRTEGHKLARHLVANGIACASISYTLMMRGRGFGCDIPTEEKVEAIQVAASQTWEATSYLLSRVEELGVDPSWIFLAGSSAGAETILHAAFWDRGEMKLSDHGLPASFKYAGVISGAGAIMELNLISAENSMPMFAFHGDADPLVPYATAAHHFCPPDSPGWLMLFGSESIADHLQALGESVQLISFTGGGHGHAGEYFYQNQQRIVDFISMVSSGVSFGHREVRPGK